MRGVLLAGVGVRVGLFVIQRCLQDERSNFEVLPFSHGGGGNDKISDLGEGLTGGVDHEKKRALGKDLSELLRYTLYRDTPLHLRRDTREGLTPWNRKQVICYVSEKNTFFRHVERD